MRIYKIILAVLALLILFYNFHIANETKYESYGDAAEFVSLGVSLSKIQKYGHLQNDESIIESFQRNNIDQNDFLFGGHSTWRPPVWPLLIAGIFLIFGYNLTYLIIFKFLLHLAGTLVFYKTLKVLKVKELMIITGTFIYGLHPAWQLYSRVFLSEPITLFFITLWVYLLSKFEYGKTSWWPQAIVAGVLILSHPYFIFLPFSVWFVQLIKKQYSLRLFIISSIACSTIVSIWIIRNFVVLETNEIVITTSSGAVMAKGWNQDVTKDHTNTQGDLANEGLVLKDYPYNNSTYLNEVERMKLYKDASLYFIKSHPEKIAPIIASKLKSAFNPFPETSKPGILETGRWLFQFLALLALIYILLYSKNKLFKSLALGLILSTVGITILTFSGFRFRMPQVGLELVLILITIQDIHFYLKSGKTN